MQTRTWLKSRASPDASVFVGVDGPGDAPTHELHLGEERHGAEPQAAAQHDERALEILDREHLHGHNGHLNYRGAFDSAKNHKRQRRKRQSVTAKREKSQTPKFV